MTIPYEKKLIEAAASAAGYELRHVDGVPHIVQREESELTQRTTQSAPPPTTERTTEPTTQRTAQDTYKLVPWRPREDDGDSLRLAVSLGFFQPGQWPDPSGEAMKQLDSTGTVDWNSATRNAVFLAAAARGSIAQQSMDVALATGVQR